MFSTLKDWEIHIGSLHSRTIDLTLDRVAAVLRRMAMQRPAATVITVAGTNGKGSAVAMLEAILNDAGHRVGAYTSPHLVRYNERVRLAGRTATDSELCRAFERVEDARGDIPLTYFEFGTLAAFEAMYTAAVDIALLEVGLGGRLDATNAVDADAALVTSVAIDHSQWLGPDRESIGAEKAGIFRPGRPAVCGDPEPPRSLLAAARRREACLYRIGTDFGYQRQARGWRWWGPDVEHNDLPCPSLRGRAQFHNAAAVLMTLHALSPRLSITTDALRRGLTEVVLPGRFQVLSGPPLQVLDVAHNLAAAVELGQNLTAQPVSGRTFAVCAMLEDKPIEEIVAALSARVDAWFVADLNVERGASGERLRRAVAASTGNAPVTVFPEVVQAYRAALAQAGADDRVVGFGSFYTVGAIIAHLDQG